ncbi:tRNA-His guanylyltransferase [Ascosphaera pollenicola]|nr:tRNA-His guanylyltransferase [Ascosphaera pollenicola]
MANSRYEYTRLFEQQDSLLPNTWIVIRIDGIGFHKFSKHYNFEKPNDVRALNVMNDAAVAVMKRYSDLVLAYGQSDEYSFVFHKSCQLWERRASKLTTAVVSTFTASYCRYWPIHFPAQPLDPEMEPAFDGRAVLYPSDTNLRDYLCWRQADCHINNLYNTTFWNIVLKGGMSNQEAEVALKGTLAADKNEILFSRFGINYNNESEMYKKGSVIYREYEMGSMAAQPTPGGQQPGQQLEDRPEELSRSKADKLRKLRTKAEVVIRHVDIFNDDFWNQRPWILSGKPGKLPDKNA